MSKLRDIDGAREFVRDHADLPMVVETYGYKTEPFSHDHVVCLCPFHEETEPSFAISESKQLYMCYGCKEGGDVFSFIQKIEGVGHVEAIRMLAKLVNVSLAAFESEETPEEKRQAVLYALNERAMEVCEGKDSKFKKWVKSRVLYIDVLKQYGVGYASAPPRIHGDRQDIEDLGLDRKFQWTNAVVVPVRDSSGRVAAFRNRPLDGGKAKSVAAKKSHPLSVPPVYGYHEARKDIRSAGSRVILVEGEVDVWQMRAYGFPNVCGTMGTSFGMDGLDYLADHGVSEAVVMPDGDEGGRMFASRMSQLHHPRITIKIATLEEGDPDEILLTDGAEVIQSAIDSARYGIEYLVERALYRPLLTITDKVDALTDLKPVMSKCSKIEEELAIGVLAERLDMDAASITDFFRDVDPDDAMLYDVKSERIVLARMVEDSEFIGSALQVLDSSDFHMVRHGQIFDAIAEMYRAGQPVDTNTVAITLERRGAPSAVRVLENIEGSASTVSSFMLDALREKSMRRRMQSIGRGLMADSANPTIDPHIVAQTMMASVSKVIVGGFNAPTVGELVEKFVGTLHERMKAPDLIIGHDFGMHWQTLNRTIHGLSPGRFMVLAAPSGVGKTSAAIGWLARFGVELSIPSLMLTLETDTETLTQRLISYCSGVQQEAMQTGYVSKEDVQLIHAAASMVSASPVRILERGRTLEELQAIVRHDQMVRGTQIVFVDYVQLMDLASADARTSRTQVVGEISRGLLDLALETDIDVIAMAQINREGAKKFTSADHTDIGEAFKIAQDADIFVTFTEKSPAEIATEGPEKGNRYARINKNRRDGKSNVSWSMQADLEVQLVKEVVT